MEPPIALLSLSTFSLAMSLAYIRLEPFEHLKKINDYAKESLESLKVSEKEEARQYVQELRHLAGEKIKKKREDRPKKSGLLKIVKVCDQGLVSVCVVVSFLWLAGSSSAMFDIDFMWDIITGCLGNTTILSAFWSLMSAIFVLTALGMYGHSFVSRAKTRVDSLTQEIRNWMAERTSKAPDPER